MSYRLEIRPYALADIAEAVGWYDEQEAGLGSEFAHEVLEAIDALPNNPLMYRLRHTRKNVRWKLLHRFPYRIVFRIEDSLITVLAVLHSAPRSPVEETSVVLIKKAEHYATKPPVNVKEK